MPGIGGRESYEMSLVAVLRVLVRFNTRENRNKRH